MYLVHPLFYGPRVYFFLFRGILGSVKISAPVAVILEETSTAV